MKESLTEFQAFEQDAIFRPRVFQDVPISFGAVELPAREGMVSARMSCSCASSQNDWLFASLRLSDITCLPAHKSMRLGNS